MPALGACTRCGTFFCAQDRRTVDSKDYCASCATRPEVDYLEAFRLKYWGKRDLWAWLIGFGALINAIVGLVLLASGAEQLLFALMTLVSAAVGMCFWAGLSFARLALCFVPVVSMIVGVATQGPAGLASGVMPLIITLVIYNDTRNKLFFREEVSPEALQKAWHLYSNNRIARAGFLLSILGILMPPVAPVALLCSIIGLRRVDPTAHPPIGRRGQAIAGIVLGVLGILWGLTVLGFMVANGR
ncbi:hypothetical protein [Hyalangium gracile]|uniref:hypothetical protein n=1 Tax=Hyalangium gracile TaxID=394092 RepID=UPI001CCFA2BA|nr:hypothetical protein [Hyalangium gracile]